MEGIENWKQKVKTTVEKKKIKKIKRKKVKQKKSKSASVGVFN